MISIQLPRDERKALTGICFYERTSRGEEKENSGLGPHTLVVLLVAVLQIYQYLHTF